MSENHRPDATKLKIDIFLDNIATLDDIYNE